MLFELRDAVVNPFQKFYFYFYICCKNWLPLDDLGVGRLPEANIFPFWLFSPLYDVFVGLQDFVVRHGLYLRERFHLPNKKLSITYMFKRW
jgi:hypothetical protein